MGSIFRRSVRHFSASSSELRPGVSGQGLVDEDIPTEGATETLTTRIIQSREAPF